MRVLRPKKTPEADSKVWEYSGQRKLRKRLPTFGSTPAKEKRDKTAHTVEKRSEALKAPQHQPSPWARRQRVRAPRSAPRSSSSRFPRIRTTTRIRSAPSKLAQNNGSDGEACATLPLRRRRSPRNSSPRLRSVGRRGRRTRVSEPQRASRAHGQPRRSRGDEHARVAG